MTTVSINGLGTDLVYSFFTTSTTIISASSTQFVLDDTGFISGTGRVLTVNGTGLTYGDPNNGTLLTGGTITSLTLQEASGYSETWSGFSVSALTAYNYLKAANSTGFFNLFLGGNDTFNITSQLPPSNVSKVVVNGFDGDDIFNFNSSANNYFVFSIDGGAGNNIVNLSGGLSSTANPLSPSITSANLNLLNVQKVHLAPGANYTIVPERPLTIDGSDLGASDTLTVDTNTGFAPTSLTLLGGAGNDILQGGSGNDIFNGGAGSDLVTYLTGPQTGSNGVTVDLSLSGAQAVGNGRGSDTFISIENLGGTNTDDHLSGDANANILYGFDGNDYLYGGTGNDTLIGGNGWDEAHFVVDASGITVNLSTGTAISASQGNDTLSGIEVISVDGYNATLTGDDNDNNLLAAYGTNMLSGGGGNDILADKGSNSVLDGGAGFDAAILYRAPDHPAGTNPVDPDYSFTFTPGVDQTMADGTQLKSIEQIFLTTGNGNDSLTIIHPSETVVSAGPGSPTRSGWDAGTGNDTVTLDLSNWTDSVSMSVFDAPSPALVYINGNSSSPNFSFYHVENFNVIGGSNGDRIQTGAGNDTIKGNGGNDILDGGAGIDVAIYIGNRAAYSITPAGTGSYTVDGPEGIDGLTHIERIQFNDRLVFLGITPPSDTDGDGRSDILLQNDNGQIGLWRMNGTTVSSNNPVGSNPGTAWHVRGTGDVNDDGKADILFQNDNGSVAIWFMNGTTVAASPIVGTNPGTGWHVKGSGDFNGDGKGDILFQNDDGRIAFWMMSGPTVTSSPIVGTNPGASWHAITTGDFDGDGKSDILWQNNDGRAALWLMNGTTVATNAIVGTNPGANWHVKGAGDFDGDGKSDILFQNDDGGVAVWLMNGTTVTANVLVGSNPGTTWHVEGAGDYDSDGKADILFQNEDGRTALWLMNGTTIASNTIIGVGADPTWHVKGSGNPGYGHSVRDFNHDGISDILLQNDDGRATIWTMNGTTIDSNTIAGTNPGVPWSIKGSGDFDGDGYADILFQNSDGRVAFWLMNGTTVLSNPEVGTNPGTAWHAISSGDFDGDGKSDIVFQNDNGSVAFWMMSGTAVLSSPIIGTNPGTAWHVKGTGDFNGDGKSDIVFQNDDGSVDIWTMNGTTITSNVLVSNPGASWHVAGAGDFDGDGKSDIVFQNDNGSVAIWTMNGTAITSSPLVGTNPGTSWHVKGTGDLNADGKSDIIFQNDDGSVAAWVMSGTTVTSSPVISNPGTSWHVVAG